jgi:hypothetical protein
MRLRQSNVLLATAALLAATGVRADQADWRALWKRGLAEFKKKNYVAACPLFASAGEAQPKNGAIWGDLGFCYLKLGGAGASIHPSRLAAHFGDERVRKAAYYNLGLAGESITLPAEGCMEVESSVEAQCKQPVFACTKSWSGSGSVFYQSGKVAFFGRTLAEAQEGADGMRELDPDASSIGAGVALYEEHSNSCGSWCDMHAWEGRDASPVTKQVAACLQKQKGPYPGPPDPCVRQGKRCTDYFECAETVLSHVADTPAIAREWNRMHAQCVSECTSNSDEAPRPSCRVVYADACRRRLGVVCETPKEHGPGSTLEASELTLSEP